MGRRTRKLVFDKSIVWDEKFLEMDGAYGGATI